MPGDEDFVSEEQMDLPGDDQHQPHLQTFKAKRRIKFPKKFFKIIGVIILVGALGFGAWKLIPSKDEDGTKTQPIQSQEASSPPNSDLHQSLGDANLSEEHKSDFLRISFKHPSSWKVNEASDAIIVSSPNFKYRQNNGMDKDGFFKIYIKKGATDTDGKYIGRGYAVSPSEKITYTEPATGQRKDTFITGFGFDDPDNFAYFIVQGNFDLKKGDTLGPNFAKEVDAYVISGGFSSSDLTDSLATNIMSVNEYQSNEAYKIAVEIIKSLKLV